MTKTKKNAAPKFFKPVFTALLAALIVLLTFTVGSLRIGPITITFNCLPLAVGTVFLGPVYGAILGLVFGLSSFFASFTSASLTTILLSINPFFTFLMCVVPRVICGWLPGLLFQRLPKNSEPKRLGTATSLPAMSFCSSSHSRASTRSLRSFSTSCSAPRSAERCSP